MSTFAREIGIGSAARRTKPNALAAIAREIHGIGIPQLEAFVAGGNLSVELLQKLAKVLYPHSEYDPELNMMRPANKEPARSFIYPPPVQPGPGVGENRGIKLPEAAQSKPKSKGRPGWLGGLF